MDKQKCLDHSKLPGPNWVEILSSNKMIGNMSYLVVVILHLLKAITSNYKPCKFEFFQVFRQHSLLK